MIFDFTHSAYFIGSLFFLIAWLVIFYIRKDLRQEMVFSGVVIAILNVVGQQFWWSHDWWYPLNITASRVGIEDLILGFAAGGIAAVMYEFAFRKRLYAPKVHPNHTKAFLFICGLVLLALAILFWFFGVYSFWASIIALILGAWVILFFRPELLVSALLNGVLLVFISLPFYVIVAAFDPNWISKTYLFHYLTGILFLGIPIEDLLFWFALGLMLAPAYEYWRCAKLRSLPTRARS